MRVLSDRGLCTGLRGTVELRDQPKESLITS